MKNVVLNDSFGSPHVFGYPKLTAQEEINLLASFFEQLLIFDKVTLSTSHVNFALTFLFKTIGINNVERLLESGYLDFMLWSPIIVTGTGMQRDDKTIDESVIYGRPPIVAGSLTKEDLDPEKNINNALNNFAIHKDRKKSFTKKAAKYYSIPDGMLFSTDSASLVIDAYKNNNLEYLGLPFQKEPEQLNVEERGTLLDLGNKVLETAILSKYELKSYENYEPYAICKKNLENIGKAYNVSNNTSNLFHLENLPDLKTLFISERLDFESVFKIRHFTAAKYYRRWINEIGENANSQEVSKEYLNEIRGSSKFFESNQGKLLKNLSLFAVGTALGNAVVGNAGVVAGLSLGLLDTFWIDRIAKGKNPSIFINEISNYVAEDKKMPPL
jgi:hypothetical protein